MNRAELNFTKEEAIKIQQQHLAEWDRVLMPWSAEALRTWAEATNVAVKDPFEIRRGADLTSYIINELVATSYLQQTI